MNFSKSKYRAFWTCPKMAWLDKYKPEVCVYDESAEARKREGIEVGDLAMGLFGDFVKVTTLKADGSLDKVAMADKTTELIKSGTDNICEASFFYGGLYCAVDILHKENGGYAIYEVKATKTFDIKNPTPIYIVDVAFQKYVLTKCGINVTGTYLVHLNKDYVRHGDIDVSKMFTTVDISAHVATEYAMVEENLAKAEVLLSGDEPTTYFPKQCGKPHDCKYWDYCAKDLPTPSVFDVRGKFDDLDYYKQGIVSFKDIIDNQLQLTPKQKMQIDYELQDKGIYADKEAIGKFLDQLSYPLYFLDYETMCPAIPLFDGASPHEQIAFQYSLHYYEEENGELKHKEFLAESGKDPRRLLAERLVKDIPTDNKPCILIFNKSTEPTITKKLAGSFPDLSDKLNIIAQCMVDLQDVFSKGHYYRKEFCGSYSIKYILPGMFPDDPSLSYKSLSGVHNGSQAMTLYPKLKDMPEPEMSQTTEDLLRYCELDTFAMVKILEELKRVSR